MAVQIDKDALQLLEDTSSNNDAVLSKTIRWDALQDATIIKPKDLELIQRYDKKPLQTKLTLFQERGAEYAALFLNMIADMQAKDKLQYVLALVDELLSADESKASYFLQITEKRFPYGPFVRLLGDSDWFTTAKACKILATLMLKGRDVAPEDLQQAFRWINDVLRTKKDLSELYGALNILQILLRRDQFRLVYAQDNGLHRLGGLIAPNSNFQLLYQILYCVWLLSYNEKIVKDGFAPSNIIPKIVEVTKTAAKEKVQRMCLAILKNLIDQSHANNEQMIESGLIKIIDTLYAKKWGDEDIVADLEAVKESLQKNLARLSSFDIYKQELMSGNLEWSPVHKSEKFWRENCQRFEENNNRALGVLINLLKDQSSSPTALAVACYDLGEFVHFHPRGRLILQNLNAKQYVMGLMSHPDPEVQKHALLCIQKVMVHNWEYLSR